ncbi:MAG: DUF2182 domain-containing protein [Granulosicoccus sp.]|nr:DUF2182 domain-containing protein [Granulosicoccus sp.]
MTDTSIYADSKITRSLGTREYAIVAAGLALITLAGWAYMGYMAWAMANMDKVEMWMPPMGATPWSTMDLFMLFLMWAIMMVAMMTPSTLPMVNMFATINKNRRKQAQLYTPTFVFIFGYLIAWALFSVLAAVAQWWMHTASLLNPMMNSRSDLVSGIVLIVAGIYQWTPAKDACLEYCRTPVDFLMTEWRDGSGGALYMGIKHGIYCVGCCWALMLVLFAVGVMNMLWVALIAAFVVLEKIFPYPWGLRLVSGIALVVWGAYLLAKSFGYA